MKRLLTTMAVLTVIATPSLAQPNDTVQPYDTGGTSIGAAHSEEFYTRAYGAAAAVKHARPQVRALRGSIRHPTRADEELLFDHARGEIE